MTRILIVATNDDLQTCLTSYWAKSLQRCLASAGHETELLSGHDVTFTGLRNAIASAPPVIGLTFVAVLILKKGLNKYCAGYAERTGGT